MNVPIQLVIVLPVILFGSGFLLGMLHAARLIRTQDPNRQEQRQ